MLGRCREDRAVLRRIKHPTPRGGELLNEQVRRNRDRFPTDFIFEVTDEELANLKSHFATSSWCGRRKRPM